MILHGGGRSQEDASTFGTGERAILVVVIVVPPGHVVWDQVPAVIRFVLGGLRKDWAEWGGDGADGGGGGAATIVGLCSVLAVGGEVRGKL